MSYNCAFPISTSKTKFWEQPPSFFTSSGRGCAAAVLRLWLSPDSDMPPLEMCGEKTATEHWQYLTQGQTGRVSFTSADKAIGAQVSWNGLFSLSHYVT